MMRYKNFLEDFAKANESFDIIRGSLPVKRTHRKVIVISVMNSKLLFKIIKRIKPMKSIEIFIIFSVRTLNLAIMTRSIRRNELMLNTIFFKRVFKKSRLSALNR